MEEFLHNFVEMCTAASIFNYFELVWKPRIFTSSIFCRAILFSVVLFLVPVCINNSLGLGLY